MNRRDGDCHAFSLVEVTLALGVAAFCLIAVLGLLPVGLKIQSSGINQTAANSIISEIISDLSAAARLPPGQASKQFSLHNRWDPTPDFLYFTNEGQQAGNTNQQNPPADAVFRATITYIQATAQTSTLANIKVTWPAAQSDLTKVSGSAETLAAIDRAMP
jgi:uncharacterized protein (TIGR02598 family)